MCRGGAFDTKFPSANFEAGSIEQQHGSRRRNGVRRGAGYSKVNSKASWCTFAVSLFSFTSLRIESTLNMF